MRSPPGKEIYQKGSLSVFEVDGKDYKVRLKFRKKVFELKIKINVFLALLPMLMSDS